MRVVNMNRRGRRVLPAHQGQRGRDSQARKVLIGIATACKTHDNAEVADQNQLVQGEDTAHHVQEDVVFADRSPRSALDGS